MKKRFPAIILALALCVGLAVPAFAADEASEPTAYRSVPEKSGILWESKTGTYQLKSCAFDESKSNYVYGEAEDLGETATLLLPKGMDLEITGIKPEDLQLIAMSDPDGDGVFHLRLFAKEPEKSASAVALPEGDSYASLADYDEGTLFNTVVTGDLLGLEVSEDGMVALASDWLYEMFDTNTMLWIGSDGELKWMFLLSGEPKLISSVFTDVPVGEWFTDPVVWAIDQGLTNGVTETSFEPGTICTQGQILTFLYRAARSAEDPDAAATAEDMISAVAWAAEKGMIDLETFDTSADCTRASAVNYIWQAFGKLEADKSEFKDVDAEAAYAAAVDWAVANGITNGTDKEAGQFSPEGTCTRGEIVTFLHRAYVEEARLTVEK